MVGAGEIVGGCVTRIRLTEAESGLLVDQEPVMLLGDGTETGVVRGVVVIVVLSNAIAVSSTVWLMVGLGDEATVAISTGLIDGGTALFSAKASGEIKARSKSSALRRNPSLGKI
jgi:hypothetical protein